MHTPRSHPPAAGLLASLLLASGACRPEPALVEAPLAPAPPTSPTHPDPSVPDDTAPEIPASLPDLVLIEDAHHTRPTIPPHRTTSDGRVAIDLKYPWIYLMSPELLQVPLPLAGGGTQAVAQRLPLDPGALYDEADYGPGVEVIGPIHHTLCDPIDEQLQLGTPLPCPDDPWMDCYEATTITAVGLVEAGVPRVQLWSARLRVAVEQPKTAGARLVDVSLSEPSPGPVLHADKVLEPMFTEDGRMLVLRLEKSSREPNTGQPLPDGVLDIVYATLPQEAQPCDLSQLGPFYPVSHAHHDDEVRGRYEIARYPLRDAHGNEIPDMADLKLSYPWIDRTGANLFFTGIGATNAVLRGGEEGFRYPARCAHPGCEAVPGAREEPALNFRGFGVAGLWTRGKAVVFDGPINHTDYGVRRVSRGHVLLQLYEPDTAPPGVHDPSGEIELGASRDFSDEEVPPLSTHNTTFLDSTEALWNYAPPLVPTRVRDVVWHLNTGKTTAQIAFDDYLDGSLLIVAEMVGALDHRDSTRTMQRYHDGFVRTTDTSRVTHSGPEHVRLQNAATTLAWAVPSHGTVSGDVRLEPVAAGGVEGKGLWLDGHDDALRFELPPQPSGSLQDHPFFVGLFLDPRFDDDGRVRQLLGLPDGSAVAIEGHHTLLYLDPQGDPVVAVPLGGAALRRATWRHLGLLVDPWQDTIELYVDGYLLHRAPHAPLRLGVGPLVVGDLEDLHAPVDGFRGWIDELKLAVGDPGPEVICNHARGTLVGLEPDHDSAWSEVADRYPDHDPITEALAEAGQPTHERYVCFSDPLALDRIRLDNLPPRSVSVRDGLLFPEGPLAHDRPRPDSSGNPFCLSCHDAASGSLSVEALVAGPLAMIDDPRRQPMQPRRVMFGNIPADLFGPGLPPAAIQADVTLIDPYLYP